MLTSGNKMQDTTQGQPAPPRFKLWRHALYGLIAFIVWYAMLVFAFDRQTHTRTPVRYLFPAGFVGVYRIEYEIKNAPPFPVEDGYLIMRFPKTGHLRTSSSPQEGMARDEYYYVSQSGAWLELPNRVDNSLVHGGGIGQAQTFLPSGKVITHPVTQTGFIGTAEQERKASAY